MPTEVFLIGAALAVAVLLGRLLAGRVGVPDAAAYVLIGVAAGLVPGLPRVQVAPDVVLLAFLPPLVYYAAFFSDPRETMEHVGAVVGQSVGLVLATAFAAAWTLLLVAFLFVLLGYQVPGIVAVVADYPVGTLLLASASLVAVVVVVRMAWALLVPPLVRRLRVGDDEISALSRQERLVLGWCGPRGAVSLAVALSLPLNMPDGAPFVRRDLLLFLTVVVVLATLVGQVLPLPALLRRLRLSPSEQERTEGLRAHRAMVDAALREVEDLAAQEEQETEGLEAMRQVLELRRDRLHRQLESESSDGHAGPDERDLQLRMLAAERKALRELARHGDIGRRTQIAIGQELDLDETRLRRAR